MLSLIGALGLILILIPRLMTIACHLQRDRAAARRMDQASVLPRRLSWAWSPAEVVPRPLRDAAPRKRARMLLW